jgi:hypothetical protein
LRAKARSFALSWRSCHRPSHEDLMKTASSARWLLVYQWLAGACDTGTGLLLVAAPEWTLGLMGIRHGPEPAVFAGFIGAFVLAVGAAYLFTACLPMDAGHARSWQTAWILTALVRTTVAGFLTWQLSAGRMEMAWSSVALTDGALALFQWLGLKKGWLHFTD